MRFTQQDKDNFFIMVDSLKKSRRANLSDINSDEDIIEKLYTDPLYEDFVLKMTMRPNTSILIGRKGVGKSTIIDRLQHEVRKSNDKLSLYIDVNSIFEQSKVFSFNAENYKNILFGEELNKYLLLKTFLKNIIEQIKEETKTNTLKFFMAKISTIFGPNKNTFLEELNSIFEDIDEKAYEDILIIKEKNITSNNSDSFLKKNEDKTKMDVVITDRKVSGAFGFENNESSSDLIENKIEEKFSEILLQYFDPKNILVKVKALLTKIGVKYVFICLDDFSEIEENAMKAFVDTIITPLNNWSEEYFKFKIAGYPGRIYLGNIDPTKIEQIKLDYYDLYLSNKVGDIEQEAINSVKRLLTQRFKYFCNKTPEYYFDTSENDMDTYYRYIFNMTSNVPRNIGWILWYANQYSVIKNEKITLKNLDIASEKFFIDAIEVFFTKNKYMRSSFTEKLEKYHLNELLNGIIKQSKENKREIMVSDSKIFESEKRPPTSHFYLFKEFEDMMKTLELNFFVTKVNEQKDQDGKLISLFALNYGLCQKEDIFYGKGKDRKYIIQRRFNYSKLIMQTINGAKEIICNFCGKIYSLEHLTSIELFGMLCPTCRKGTCSVEHVKIEVPIISEEIEILEFDFKLLNSLKISSPQYASMLAQELDCYYQKVASKVSTLISRGLIEKRKESRDDKIGEKSYYYITENAIQTYFRE